MEHPPTSSALEDSARKFRLALAAVIDGSLPGLDPHLAKALEATAAEVITQARGMHARAVDAETGFPCLAERDARARFGAAADREVEDGADEAPDYASATEWKGGPDATVRLEDERIVIAFPSPDGKWQHAYSHTAEEAATLHTRLSAALRQRTDALGVDDAAPAKPSADELRSIIDKLLSKIDRMPCTAHDFLGTALYTKAAQAVGAPWVEEVDQ